MKFIQTSQQLLVRGMAPYCGRSLFAPNGGQFEMQKSFAFPSRLPSEWSLSIEEM